MKNLIEFLLIHITQHPEDVLVVEEQDEHGYTYTINVHDDDIGRVIGKRGSVIHAIRSIAKIRAVKEHIRAYVTIAE
ncbi:MAG: KH domain-containing protein [Pseudomonadales bacterium]|nr:KH domain-containing protein [Candidatus Woesebacteria bacterium]MCB9802300.1 KH domain-containing protein [Pseudomonadales bacterium]